MRGRAWQGKVSLGHEIPQGKDRLGAARQGSAGLAKARRGKACRGKAWRGKAGGQLWGFEVEKRRWKTAWPRHG